MLNVEMKSKVMPILKKAEIDVAVAIGRDLKIVALDSSGQMLNLDADLSSAKVNIEKNDVLKSAIIEVFGEDWLKIISRKRSRELVMARQLYCWYARFWVKMSFKMIGKNIGGKDHTTAIHSCQTVQDLLDSKNEQMSGRFIQVQNKLNSISHEG
jgi:chromosomal replication initiator protein